MYTNEHIPELRQNHLDYFSHIIDGKLKTYTNSPLTPFHNHLLNIFFDLAQLYDGLDSFYQICVAVPQALHPDISAALTVLNSKKDGFQIASCSVPDQHVPTQLLTELPLSTRTASYLKDDILCLPVVSRPLPDEQDKIIEEPETTPCLGVLLIKNDKLLNSIDLLFLEKLVTRVGYNLQRRLLFASHLEHVNFLKRLGRDIGHNVITSNMHFKSLFRKLEKKINQIDEEVRNTSQLADQRAMRIITRCNEIRADLTTTHEELLGHYNRTSLYLETLLREEHFSQGKFILRARRCQIEDEIIIPELEVYRKRFTRQGITIDQPQNMRGRDFFLKVDLGLLAQVFDNLFSNAVKYTTATIDDHGRQRKAMAYGCRDVNNFPDQGKKGVKFNIFSTGEHLGDEERLTIFNDGVRGDNIGSNPGSGHGLAFVRNVVEIHGGVTGYEAVLGGNNFYFILPLPEEL